MRIPVVVQARDVRKGDMIQADGPIPKTVVQSEDQRYGRGDWGIWFEGTEWDTESDEAASSPDIELEPNQQLVVLREV